MGIRQHIYDVKPSAWIRIAISVGLLAWLLAGVDLLQLRAYLAGIPVVDVISILGLYTAAWLVNTAKWKILLDSQPYFRLFALTMIGQFYALVLPGQIAGEAIKAWKLIARSGETARAVTSILMDRLTGVMSLLLIGLTGASLTAKTIGSGFAVIFWVFILGLGLAAFLMRIEHCRTWSRSGLTAIGNRYPRFEGFTETLIRCIDAWIDYLQSPIRLLQAIALGLVFQGLAVIVVYRLSLSIGMQVAFVDWCWIFTAVSLLLLLPITVGGIGLREGGYLSLLAVLGISSEKALACSFALFALQAFTAAIGAVIDIMLTVRERSMT